MLDIGSKKIKMTIWDTAGQERFRTLTSSYYRGAQGIMLVYDVTRRDSFENLSKWLEEVEMYHPGRGRDVVKLLVGNKVDCDRVVTQEEAEAWARSKGMLFLEASAKTQVLHNQTCVHRHLNTERRQLCVALWLRVRILHQ
jgi:Ras-related protein Rab-18